MRNVSAGFSAAELVAAEPERIDLDVDAGALDLVAWCRHLEICLRQVRQHRVAHAGGGAAILHPGAQPQAALADREQREQDDAEVEDLSPDGNLVRVHLEQRVDEGRGRGARQEHEHAERHQHDDDRQQPPFLAGLQEIQELPDKPDPRCSSAACLKSFMSPSQNCRRYSSPDRADGLAFQ